MAYRGEDLELRTPQSSRSLRDPYGSGDIGLNGARTRGPSSRSETLLVDDTVLACCNHAYDVALAHGASEVRLEHLVHALTRVEAAAEVLEQRGIREAHLRRESAAVIASEIPVGLNHSHSAPRSSLEFEDVLRRATDLAASRGTGASVHDLLWVLLNYNRDIAAIALLLRHATDWQKWDWPHDERRDSVRRPAVTEPARTRVVERIVERTPPPPVPSAPIYYPQQSGDLDQVQARLDQLDRSMRQLQSELASDRRTLADMFGDLRRDLASRPAGGGAMPAGLVDRLQSLERNISAVLTANPNADLGDLVTAQVSTVTDQVRVAAEKLQLMERSLEARQTQIADRLRALDEALAAQRQQTGDLKVALTTDLRGAIERAMSSQSQGGGILQSLLNDRFQTIGQQFDQQTLAMTSAVAQLTEPMLERMRQIETTAQQRQGEQTQVLKVLGERTVQLEALVRNSGEERSEALVKLGTNQQTLATNLQTLADNLEQWRAESEGGLSIVSNRLELMERSSGAPLQALKQIQSDLQGLQQVTIADYDQNRRGLRNWLFGTEDIFAGSWRDETAQIRARLKQLREERKA
jgi:hypothetical protein